MKNSFLSDNLGSERFWVHKVNSTLISHIETNNSLTNEHIREVFAMDGIDTTRVTSGLLFFTRDDLVVPIHDGVIQPQHTTYLRQLKNSDHDNSCILCAFSPRARQNIIPTIEEDRPINKERLEALNDELQKYGINSAELLDEKMAGKPPSRIYRSFVAPRAKTVDSHIGPLSKAAKRTASQIEISLRQIRADEADYLRNNDKSLYSNRKSFPVILVLDNIRSAFNVGSLFRTGETGGVSEIVTVGITAHPPHPKLRKTALSSTDVVPSRHFDDIIDAIMQLKQENYSIIVLETTSQSKLYTEINYPDKVAFVVGNEITGVDVRVMDIADSIIEIPTYGVKNSLNVASAMPIVLFEYLRQASKR
jgi:tRNA G18 (ribose-2'-O)-methylase SpoU